MDSATAKSIIESNKSAAIAELVSRIETVITEKAGKGWNRACVENISKEYNAPIITEAYNTLRTNGFAVNVMNHTVSWI